MSNSIKQIRGQLRQIAKELLPQVLSEEVNKFIETRLTFIEENVKKTMHEMNERHKDTMGYLVRQSTVAPQTKKD